MELHFYSILLVLAVAWNGAPAFADSAWVTVCHPGGLSLSDGEVKFLTVPNFPGQGSSDSSYRVCETRVTAGPGQRIRTTFHYFNTESCCDYLRVFDGPNSNAMRLLERSGSTIPGPVTSTGNTLTFRWTNDGWGGGYGFLMSLQAIPDEGAVIASNVAESITELKTEMQEKMESFSTQLNTTLQGLKSMEHETVTKKDLADALVAMYERVRTKLNVSTKKIIDALPKCTP